MIRLLQIVGSIIALLIGLHLLNWQQLWQSASRIDVLSLLLGLLLAVASVGLVGLRWIYIVRRIAPAPLYEQCRLYCLGTFFNSFTPANIGGDVYRVLALRSWTADRSVSGLLAAVTVERILGLGSFLAGYLLALAAHMAITRGEARHLPGLLLYPAPPALLVLLVMVLLPRFRLDPFLPMRFRSGRIGGRLHDFELGARMAISANLWRLGGLSLLAWVSWAATVLTIGSNLNLNLPIATVAMIVSLTEIIRLVPISFQGIGIREGAFSVLIGLAGGSPATGFVVAAVAYAVMSLALALSGVVGAALGLIPQQWLAGAANRVGVNSPGEQ